MPAVDPEVVRGNPVELEEEYQGNQSWLDVLGKFGEPRLDRVQNRQESYQEVQGDAGDDRQRQHPVFYELQDFLHLVQIPAAGKMIQISSKSLTLFVLV